MVMVDSEPSGVLGIATGEYFIYCFFNLLSPVISLFYGFTGIKIEYARPPSGTAGTERQPAPRPIARQGGSA